MKLAQIVLINIATVVVALVAYDQFRGDAPGDSQERASTSRSNVAESVALEERLRALETRRSALRAGATVDAQFDERLEALEAALRGDKKRDMFSAPETESDSAQPIPDGVEVPTSKQSDVTKEEVARFRQLQEAVRRENSVKKNWDRINKQLDKAGVNLTPVQRERVHHAWADFEPRIMRIWGDIKTQARATIEAGGEVDRKALGEQGDAQIQSEFAASLSGIVNHQADAEAVAAALTARGGK
ncbi:MAG: hypothetical protein ACYTGZ_09575 [Planctomycetota bacterium]|jgi:hypothetical protein